MATVIEVTEQRDDCIVILYTEPVMQKTYTATPKGDGYIVKREKDDSLKKDYILLAVWVVFAFICVKNLIQILISPEMQILHVLAALFNVVLLAVIPYIWEIAPRKRVQAFLMEEPEEESDEEMIDEKP